MAELPKHLSPSSASSFDGCPRRWRFKYVDRLPEPSGQAALVGSFAHVVLEHLCQMPPEDRTMDTAKALARTLWDGFTEEDDYQSLELAEEDSRAFRWQAWLAIAGLWPLEDPATVDVVSTEQRIEVELGDVPFLGIIDRVDRSNDRLIVSDYKSGTLPGSRWREDKVLQVMLYAAALQADLGEQPDRARLLYLGQRIVDIAVTDRKVDEATEALNSTWVNIGSSCTEDTFEAKPGVLCGWCAFASDCPEGRAEITRRVAAGKMPNHAPAIALVA